MVTLGRDCHLPIIILGDIDLLGNGYHCWVSYGVVSQVGLHLLTAIGTYTHHPSFVSHTEDDMYSIDLLMSLDISLDGGGGSLDNLLKELVYSVCGAATE